MPFGNINYNPVPTRVWSRVQDRCTFDNNSGNVFIPLLNKTVSPLEADYYFKQIAKGNILQYKKNSSQLTKKQKYSQISKGLWKNRNKSFATQTETYTNPNTTSLKRVNYVEIPFPNTIVGEPNNISGPYQYNVPDPFGCKTNILKDGGNLICNTYENPCTGKVIEKTYSTQCNPTSDSDVPGKIQLLCWNAKLNTWYPRQRYIMTNSGTKWPEGYKGFVSAVKSICNNTIDTNFTQTQKIQGISNLISTSNPSTSNTTLNINTTLNTNSINTNSINPTLNTNSINLTLNTTLNTRLNTNTTLNTTYNRSDPTSNSINPISNTVNKYGDENYNPVPPRVWSRVQDSFTFDTNNGNGDVFIPLLDKTVTPLEANYYKQQIAKGNILQYKKNSSNITKNQKYSQISKGLWTNRTKSFATQTETYTNPNTTSLQRVNYTEIPFPNTLVGEPNNISGPYQYNVPNPFGCPTNVLQDGGNLVCNTVVNPCTGEVVKKTATQKYYPTTDSNVPGKVELLYWDSRLQTWYPRQRYTMNNSGTKWPEGYKGFIAAVKRICTINSIGTNITDQIEIEQIQPITIQQQEQQLKSKGQKIFDDTIVKNLMKYIITPLKNNDFTTLYTNLRNNTVELESDLKGITRRLTHDTEVYEKYTPISISNQYPTNNDCFTDESRATLPAWMFRDKVSPRWDVLFHNPQENIEIPFEVNVDTKMEEKLKYQRHNNI